jgi:hypothetical protein
MTLSSEWSVVKENIKKIEFKAIDSLEDPDLRALAEASMDTNRARRGVHVEQLREYLDKKALQDMEKEQRAKEAKKAYQSHHPHLSRAIKAAKALASPIMKTFGFLIGILENTIFIATQLTFQTQYEVALKAILLFRTVRF